MNIDEELAEIGRARDAKLAALGPRPRWWHPLARRRFDRARSLIAAIGFREVGLLMRKTYNDDDIRAQAMRPHPMFAAFIKDSQ